MLIAHEGRGRGEAVAEAKDTHVVGTEHSPPSPRLSLGEGTAFPLLLTSPTSPLLLPPPLLLLPPLLPSPSIPLLFPSPHPPPPWHASNGQVQLYMCQKMSVECQKKEG